MSTVLNPFLLSASEEPIPTGSLQLFQRFYDATDQTGNNTGTLTGGQSSAGIFASATAGLSWQQYAAGAGWAGAVSSNLITGNGVNDFAFSVTLGYRYVNGTVTRWLFSLGGNTTNLVPTDIQVDVYKNASGIVIVDLLDMTGSTLNGTLQRISSAGLGTTASKVIGIDYNGSGAASGINIYINGVLSNGAISSTGSYTAMSGVGNFAIWGNRIAWRNNTSANYQIGARLAQCGFWNQQLSEAQQLNVSDSMWAANNIL